MKTYSFYLMNNEVNSVGYVHRLLKKICALTTPGVSTAIKLIDKVDEALVFEEGTQEGACELHTKLRQTGLTGEIRTRVHGESDS